LKDCRRTGQAVRNGDAVKEEICHKVLDAGDQGRVAALKLGVDIDREDTVCAAAGLGANFTIAKGAGLHLVSKGAWRGFGLLAWLLTQ
jgi:hypothetical protein